VKLQLYVEGDTEAHALPGLVRRWLDQKAGAHVRVLVESLDGWQRFAGEIDAKVRLRLRQGDSSQLIGVIGILDLYGPQFYPAGVTTADDRVMWATKHFEAEVNDRRFRMFMAVHEIEAWILSQPSLLPPQVSKVLPSRPPEQVDFGEPPSKLLHGLYKKRLKRHYKKTVDSVNMLAMLDLQVLHDRCPYAAAFLDAVLDMARAAGAASGGAA
jgi:hypothetical protein